MKAMESTCGYFNVIKKMIKKLYRHETCHGKIHYADSVKRFCDGYIFLLIFVLTTL